MANPKHVEIVLQGKDAIDEWRATHPYEGLNLGNADLTGASLARANLTGANLTGANLSRAYLFEVDLSGAEVAGAYLFLAVFSNATLDRTQ